MGYTTQEIARLMFKSFDTVKGYRKSILEKFDTDSITEAINYAMIYRLID
jgi:DNA-binding CsgD family transcriptional regulator